MKKVILLTVAVAMFIALPLSYVFAVEVFQAPTEVIQYDADKAYNGYTLFCPFASTTQYLIDMRGNVVHTWECETTPGLYGYLMEDGVLLRGSARAAAGTADTSGLLSGGGASSGVQEIAWDGTVLWDWEWYTADHRRHHDFRKIWNNILNEYTYISIEWTRMDIDDAIALGADDTYADEWADVGRYGTADGWSPGGIVEVNAAKQVIWRWNFADHCVQNHDAAKIVDFEDAIGITRTGPTFGDPEDYPEKLDTNGLSYGDVYHVPVYDWNHCNSLDYNADLDHITINAKHWSEFYVIDHGGTFVANETVPGAKAATDDGDFLYRFGNPAAYNQGDPAGYHTEGHQQMYASHDIQWIGGANSAWDASELPGGGNFLIFDNGTWCTNMTHSEVLEIDGGWNGTAYVNPPDAGYIAKHGGSYGGVGAASYNLSNQVEWYYRSRYMNSFAGMFISGNQRLPNGNTLICSGPTGHFFEVTRGDPLATPPVYPEIVWEYINPHNRGVGIVTTQKDSHTNSAMTFRCFRYPADYPGLAGKDLTPKGTITGELGFGEVVIPSVPITGWGIPPGTASEAGAGAAAGEGGEGGY
jgi:hypothetical protein